MAHNTFDPPFDQLRDAAEAEAARRPEVDLDMALEVFAEAATLLHNGLVLDDLDEHDASAVVAGLCIDLLTPDPGAAIRSRAEAVSADPGSLHDPRGVSAAYLVTAALFKL